MQRGQWLIYIADQLPNDSDILVCFLSTDYPQREPRL
jgi:hypothetical protein